MDKINFDKEYIMQYDLINFGTGEVIASGKKRLNCLFANQFRDFGKLLIDNLHWKDSVSLRISFYPVVEELSLFD